MVVIEGTKAECLEERKKYPHQDIEDFCEFNGHWIMFLTYEDEV